MRARPPALPAAGGAGASSCRRPGARWKARFIDTLEKKTGARFQYPRPVIRMRKRRSMSRSCSLGRRECDHLHAGALCYVHRVHDVAVLPVGRRLDEHQLDRPLVVILVRSEEHTSELQSRLHLVCRLLLEKKKSNVIIRLTYMLQSNYIH